MPTTTPQVTVEALETKLGRNPQLRIFARLADAYRKNGDIQQAVQLCLEGLRTHPEYVTGRIILGRCYVEQQNLPGAIEEFTKACSTDRRNHLAIKMLADIYAKQGMTEKAGDLYAYLAKLDPYNVSLKHLSGQFKGNGKSDLYDILGLQYPEVSFQESDFVGASNDQLSNGDQVEILEPMPGDAGNEDTGIQDAGIAVDEMEVDARDSIGIEGTDIDQRVAMMFGLEEGTAESKVSPEEPVFSNSIEEPELQIAPPLVDVSAPVSGNDITDRIDELFSESPQPVKEEPEQLEFGIESLEQDSNDFILDQHLEETLQIDQSTLREQIALCEARQSELTDEIIEEFPTQSIEQSSLVEEDSFDDFQNAITQAIEPDSDATVDTADVQEALVSEPVVDNRESDQLIQVDLPSEENATFENSATAFIEGPAVMEEAISGDDVVDKLDDIFGDKDLCASSLPDDEPEEVLQDFYSVNGDNALQSDTPAAEVQELEEQPDDILDIQEVLEQPLELTEGPQPIEELQQDEEVLAVTKQPEPETEKEVPDLQAAEEPAVDGPPTISGQDVKKRLDEYFPPEDLTLIDGKATDLIPEGDDDEPVSEFYTESGDSAIAGSGDAMFVEQQETADSLDAEELVVDKPDIELDINPEVFNDNPVEEISALPDERAPEMEDAAVKSDFTQTDELVPAGDPHSELMDIIGTELSSADMDIQTEELSSEPDAFISDKPVSEIEAEETIIDGNSYFTDETSVQDTAPVDERDKPYSIPDHVLTPTLADIYFQQGQPQLALQIYTRLCERDPDNEKLNSRLDEIKKAIESGEVSSELPYQSSYSSKPKQAAAEKSARKKKAESDGRPLSGVRIKKKKKSLKNKRPTRE